MENKIGAPSTGVDRAVVPSALVLLERKWLAVVFCAPA